MKDHRKHPIQVAWTRRRQLAAVVGVDEALLVAADGIVGDEERAARAPDSWRHDSLEAISRVDDAMLAKVGEGNVPAAPFYAYRRDVAAKLKDRFSRLDAEVGKAPVLVYWGYILTCMAGAGDTMDELTKDIPHLDDGLGHAALTARTSNDPEVQARALAESIADLAEGVYKPLLKVIYRLTLRKYQQPTPNREPRMLGELISSLRRLWNADPSHYTPIDAFIDDDAIFVRNGVAHGRTRMRFNPTTQKLVISNPPVTRAFLVSDLRTIIGSLFYNRIKPMWLALMKVSGRLDEERAVCGVEASTGPSES